MRAAGGKAGGDVRSWTGGDQRRSRKSVHADGLVIAGLTLPTGSWGHVSARLAATAARADASRMSDLCMVLQRQARDESPWVRPCRERATVAAEEGPSSALERTFSMFFAAKGSVECLFVKGSVESTHKVPTSHYHTKHCHAAVVTPISQAKSTRIEESRKPAGIPSHTSQTPAAPPRAHSCVFMYVNTPRARAHSCSRHVTRKPPRRSRRSTRRATRPARGLLR